MATMLISPLSSPSATSSMAQTSTTPMTNMMRTTKTIFSKNHLECPGQRGPQANVVEEEEPPPRSPLSQFLCILRGTSFIRDRTMEITLDLRDLTAEDQQSLAGFLSMCNNASSLCIVDSGYNQAVNVLKSNPEPRSQARPTGILLPNLHSVHSITLGYAYLDRQTDHNAFIEYLSWRTEKGKRIPNVTLSKPEGLVLSPESHCFADKLTVFEIKGTWPSSGGTIDYPPRFWIFEPISDT
ncbi:hypothetical protein BDZ97DRAFT_1273771 [Flammula alnicola]|nr:hypothetical protein BDZ97DRAFT_1273771 [Flammula alnicola]